MLEGKRTKSHHKSKSGTGTTKRVACKSKKKKWIPMAIYRTPLNPEQAVLSCCNQTRVVVAGAHQCGMVGGRCTGWAWQYSASS